MGFFGKLVGAAGVFEGAFVMPVSRGIIAFFVVLGGGAMGARGQFVLLRSLAV